MSEYTDALDDIINNNRNDLAAALMTGAILQQQAPELFSEAQFIEGGEEADTLMGVVTSALEALKSAGRLPADEDHAGAFEALNDERRRTLLCMLAATVMDYAKKPEVLEELGLPSDLDLTGKEEAGERADS